MSHSSVAPVVRTMLSRCFDDNGHVNRQSERDVTVDGCTDLNVELVRHVANDGVSADMWFSLNLSFSLGRYHCTVKTVNRIVPGSDNNTRACSLHVTVTDSWLNTVNEVLVKFTFDTGDVSFALDINVTTTKSSSKLVFGVPSVPLMFSDDVSSRTVAGLDVAVKMFSQYLEGLPSRVLSVLDIQAWSRVLLFYTVLHVERSVWVARMAVSATDGNPICATQPVKGTLPECMASKSGFEFAGFAEVALFDTGYGDVVKDMLNGWVVPGRCVGSSSYNLQEDGSILVVDNWNGVDVTGISDSKPYLPKHMAYPLRTGN